jgi:adsorption protein B
MAALSAWAAWIDNLVATLLGPLAVLILLSGLDDLTLPSLWFWSWWRSRRHASRFPAVEEMRLCPEKRIAIFVPCWHESAVIAKMIEHNVAAINYRNYSFFVGAYPNDPATVTALRELETRFANVHLAMCPHDGPTSKADCLNWIYQRMLLFEEDSAIHFDLVLTHDAEDLVHPESLTTINYYSGDYDMVQIPVLPLPTPFSRFTHGVYCDEFAESQFKDMPARVSMGAFIPSCGVGTGYSRAALEEMAQSNCNRIFEPACLTEDYENGIRLHRLGCRQKFVPLTCGANGLIATREFFPATRAAAIRQRTRWITGIALQSWERHGWSGPAANLYWYWRDRKGLIGTPLSFVVNLMFGWGLATLVFAWARHHSWGLGEHQLHPLLLAAVLLLQMTFLGIRMIAVSRIYGWRFALGVPLRVFLANYLNAVASWRAVSRYVAARRRRQPLVWVKTEHAYPSRNALLSHKRPLGEILVGSGYVSREVLDSAVASKPATIRIGEYLVQIGAITYDELYEAISLQQSVPAGRIEASEIPGKVARALPRKVIQTWKVLPYRIAEGTLYVASPEIPTDEMNMELQGFTRMNLRFQLVTPDNFEQLTHALVQ